MEDPNPESRVAPDRPFGTRVMAHPTGPTLAPGNTVALADTHSMATSRRQLSLITWIGATLLAGICAFGAAITPTLSARIVLAALALGGYTVALLALLAPEEEQFGLPRLRLASWLLLYAAFSYGLATVTLAQPQMGPQALLNRDTTPSALLLVAAGLTAMTIGYRVGPTNLSARAVTAILTIARFRYTRSPRSSSGLVTAYFAGLSVLIAQALLEGRLGYAGGAEITASSDVPVYSQALTVLTALTTASLFGLATRVANERRLGDGLILMAFASVQLVISLLSGLKEDYLTVIIAVGLPFLIRRRRLPLAGISAALLVFIFLVTPFVTTFREEIRTQANRLDLSSSIATGARLLWSGDFLPNRSLDSADPTQATVLRVRLIDNLIIIMDKTPATIPYRSSGEVVAAPALGLIPRVIWPDKPVRLSGLEFYKNYWKGQGTSSSAITLQGSLYMYGGPTFLLLGMLLFGWLIRGVDETIVRFDPYRGGLLALTLVAVIIKQEIDIAGLLAGIPVLIATYYISLLATTRLDQK